MTMDEKNLPEIEAPSRKAIAKATGIALAVALLLLFTTVLPAEYGVDPLKTGAALGLTGLAKSGDSNAKVAQRPPPRPDRPECTRPSRPLIKSIQKTSRCFLAKESRSNITCKKAR